MRDEMIEQLLQHYAEELTSYQEIHSMATIQQELCAQEELTGADAIKKFADILTRREEKIAIVAEKIRQRKIIETSLAQQLGLTQQDSAALAASLNVHAPCAAARQISVLLPRIAALLQQISALDRQSGQSLVAAWEQLKEKIAQLQGWKRAKEAYYPPVQQKEGYFIEHNR
jgi:predicted DNA-binding protein YlxM (UPF0122 family)